MAHIGNVQKSHSLTTLSKLQSRVLGSSYQPPGTGTVMWEVSKKVSTSVDKDKEIVAKSCLVQAR